MLRALARALTTTSKREMINCYYFTLNTFTPKTFKVKVTAPNATNIQYLTTLLISPAEFSMHALN